MDVLRRRLEPQPVVTFRTVVFSGPVLNMAPRDIAFLEFLGAAESSAPYAVHSCYDSGV